VEPEEQEQKVKPGLQEGQGEQVGLVELEQLVKLDLQAELEEQV